MHAKSCMILGGSDGNGKETAVKLARMNARVLIASDNVIKLNSAAIEIRGIYKCYFN